MSRADCIGQAAQHAVDGWQRLHELVGRVGTEEAARLVHYAGHKLSVAEIRQRLEGLASRKGAA